MLFALSLAKKLGGKGLLAFSVHPGVVGTNLVRYMGDKEFKALRTYLPAVIV